MVLDRIVRFYCYGRVGVTLTTGQTFLWQTITIFFSLFFFASSSLSCVPRVAESTNSLSINKRPAFSFTLFNFISLRRFHLPFVPIRQSQLVYPTCIVGIRIFVCVERTIFLQELRFVFLGVWMPWKLGCVIKLRKSSITRRWHIFRSLERFFLVVSYSTQTNDIPVCRACRILGCVRSLVFGKSCWSARATLIRSCHTHTLSHYNGQKICANKVPLFTTIV